ncbi:transposase [Streptomyces sp. O3]
MQVERVWSVGGVVRIGARTRLLTVACPDCGRGSARVHLMRMQLPPTATPLGTGRGRLRAVRRRLRHLAVDADTRLLFTLWAGRDAEQLATWLRQHPGVETVCRDGSLQYRQGISDGAPNATRVSDRFHLWQGLSKRVSDIAAAHRGCLSAAVPEPELASPPPSAEPSEEADTPARRHAQRLFEAVHTVSGAGRSLSAIARELGLNRHTVAKYARAGSWQECVRRTPPAGQPTPFNSDVNEGRITDLKLQKRIMAGRAGVRCSASASSSWRTSDAATRDGASPAHGGTPSLHENLAGPSNPPSAVVWCRFGTSRARCSRSPRR